MLIVLSNLSATAFITGTTTVFPNKSKPSFSLTSNFISSGYPQIRRPSRRLKRLSPPLSTTYNFCISIATSVGAISFGDNILFISKLSFPATILYPFGLVVSYSLRLVITPFLFFSLINFFGYSNFKYPFLSNLLVTLRG